MMRQRCTIVPPGLDRCVAVPQLVTIVPVSLATTPDYATRAATGRVEEGEVVWSAQPGSYSARPRPNFEFIPRLGP